MADSIQMGVRESKRMFFNTEAVKRSIGAATQKALSRQGAYIRQRMKGSLRYRKKASKSPDPPSVHRTESFRRTTTNRKTGVQTVRATSPLKELVFFAYDPATRSVVVGPAKFGSSPGVVPPTLEKGGPAAFIEQLPKEKKGPKASPRQAETFRRLVKEGRIIVEPGPLKIKTYRMAPRPFVRPAGEAEAASERSRDTMRNIIG